MSKPMPSPSPARAVYGYSTYLLSSTLFILYILWALLPTEEFGLQYLPDKYFLLCVPNVLFMGFTLFILVLFPAYSFTMTANVDELASVADSKLLGQRPGGEVPSFLQMKQHMINKKCNQLQKDIGEMVGACTHCGEIHKRAGSGPRFNPIPALEFMDLNEINRLLFD